jgi:ribA/ribD-fused uncharacterized protein
MNVIDSFSGEYEFLSNFYPSIVIDELSIMYPSVEHAFQAAKTLDKSLRETFLAPKLTPGQAKRLGRKLVLREDWEDVKIDVMHKLLRSKFGHPILKFSLIQTGDAMLIEGNYWHDEVWGVCSCPKHGKGTNHLGKLLMKVREELQNVGQTN